jgi:hypothetical protein
MHNYNEVIFVLKERAEMGVSCNPRDFQPGSIVLNTMRCLKEPSYFCHIWGRNTDFKYEMCKLWVKICFLNKEVIFCLFEISNCHITDGTPLSHPHLKRMWIVFLY